MKKEFKVLSLKEENQLTPEELKQYYVELREYLSKRKLTNTTPGATTIAPKLKGVTNKICEVVIKAFTNKNIEIVCDGQENIPEGTVLFAHTHQGLLDNFAWIPEIDRHCLILHSEDANKLLLLCQINTGLILIKKGDKENGINAKMDMIKVLLEGHSLSYFPESAWNLSPNKLHLPLKYGIIDVAKKAQVPIVPVAHEYTYDTTGEKEKIIKIHSRYGTPIYVSEKDDLGEKLEELSAQFSTMKFELIEEKGTFIREQISNFDYINFLKGNYKNLELGKISIDKERENLYRANEEFYKFYHINDVPFSENGELLETEEVIKLKTLNKKHNI